MVGIFVMPFCMKDEFFIEVSSAGSSTVNKELAATAVSESEETATVQRTEV